MILLSTKGIATSKLSKISNFRVKTGIYFTSKEADARNEGNIMPSYRENLLELTG